MQTVTLTGFIAYLTNLRDNAQSQTEQEKYQTLITQLTNSENTVTLTTDEEEWQMQMD